MNSINPLRNKVFTPIILYLTTAIIAVVLGVVALVIWIAEILNSGLFASLIVGVFFLLLATIIYWWSARRSIEYIRYRLDTIYDVAHSAQRGYQKIINIIRLFIE